MDLQRDLTCDLYLHANNYIHMQPCTGCGHAQQCQMQAVGHRVPWLAATTVLHAETQWGSQKLCPAQHHIEFAATTLQAVLQLTKFTEEAGCTGQRAAQCCASNTAQLYGLHIQSKEVYEYALCITLHDNHMQCCNQPVHHDAYLLVTGSSQVQAVQAWAAANTWLCQTWLAGHLGEALTTHPILPTPPAPHVVAHVTAHMALQQLHHVARMHHKHWQHL